MLSTHSPDKRTLYHGTSSRNLDCIKTIGLVPGYHKGGDAWAKEHHMPVAVLSKLREPSVFVAERVAEAEDFAKLAAREIGGEPVVVTLHVPEQVFATFYVDELFEQDDDGPHAWRAHHVDAEYVGEVIPVEPGPPFVSRLALLKALTELLSETRAHVG